LRRLVEVSRSPRAGCPSCPTCASSALFRHFRVMCHIVVTNSERRDRATAGPAASIRRRHLRRLYCLYIRGDRISAPQRSISRRDAARLVDSATFAEGKLVWSRSRREWEGIPKVLRARGDSRTCKLFATPRLCVKSVGNLQSPIANRQFLHKARETRSGGMYIQCMAGKGSARSGWFAGKDLTRQAAPLRARYGGSLTVAI